MRLLALDLERYGPFTGKRLEFRDDARLHVVYGPNEAGKSSALAAVTDLLFGIEFRTRWGFLHPSREMALAARIRARDGRELAFRRRKVKPLLTDAGGAAIADDALAPFLGGLSREIFRRAFGLDAEGLRASGRELGTSEGELGAALFAAASGLRGVGAVKAAIEAEADEIFAERRAQNRRFYQALDRHEAARKALRESETRAGALNALREREAESRGREAEIGARRRAIAVERARLERLRRARPLVARIDLETEALAGLGPLPAVAAGSGADLAAALADVAEARRAVADAAAERDRLAAARAAVAVDTAILGHEPAIDALRTRQGGYDKGRLDLPGVEREEDAAARALAALAARLGLAGADALATRPPDAALRRVEEHAAAVAEAERDRAESRRGVAREEDALEEQRRRRETEGRLADPAPFAERLAALARLRRPAEDAESARAEIAAEAEALTGAAARLMPPVADLAALAARPLPGREAIARCADRLAEAEAGLRAAENERLQAERVLAEAEERRAGLAAGQTLATPERILAARAARDAHWARLRPALFDPAALAAGERADRLAAFEIARREADDLADAAVRDAAEIARHAEAMRAVERSRRALAACATAAAAAEADRRAARAEWLDLWRPAGIQPTAPREMAPWLVEVGRLVDRAEELDGRRAHLAAVEGRLAAAAPALAELAADLGLAPMPELGFLAGLERAGDAIRRLSEGWNAARGAAAVMRDTERRLEAQRAALAEAGAALAAAEARLAAALPAIGLSATASAGEAAAGIAAWKEVPAALEAHERLRRRSAGIRRDAAAFEEEVAELARLAEAEDGALAAPERLAALSRRLAAAREARTRRATADQALDRAAARFADAEAAAAAALRRLAAVAAGLGLAADADLAAIAPALAHRDAIEGRLAEARHSLAAAADGRAESELRDGLARFDPEAADADIAALAEEDARLEAEARACYAAASEAAAEQARLGGSAAAEIALQQRIGAEAELAEAAREWAVLAIAAELVGTGLQRRRADREAPLMRRASALFAGLTGGAFAGLASAYDEAEVPHLVGLRGGGEESAAPREVATAEMSEGTRDQLFFALRLAFLEDYARGAEPPPFLADDLFSSFDDARTVHGLAALAAIGGSVQPILFTHHEAVAAAAVRTLGRAADVVRLG